MLRRPAASLVPLLVLLSLACGPPSAPPPGAPAGGPPPTPVKVWTAAGSALSTELRGAGVVRAVESADLRVEAQGLVAFVGFEDGQRVRRGDVLLRLRQDAERARLADADARLALAEAKLERTRALFGRDNAARAELDQAVAERDLAVAGRDLARDGLRRTELRAPFDGVVGARDVSVGATVGPTVSITRLEDLSSLLVEVALPERALAEVGVGDPATVEVPALGRRFVAAVSYVAPRVDEAGRTVAVRLALPPDDALRPGAGATVVVRAADRADALLVPTQAVSTTATGPALWVVGEGDKAQRLSIVTGTRTATTIEVTEGLAAGQRVIVEGLVRLQPGGAVSVVGELAP